MLLLNLGTPRVALREDLFHIVHKSLAGLCIWMGCTIDLSRPLQHVPHRALGLSEVSECGLWITIDGSNVGSE